MARKLIPHKPQVNAMEAPARRDSLELRVQNRQSCSRPHGLQVEQDGSNHSCYALEDASTRPSLTNGNLVSSKIKVVTTTPTIVARLMGLDTTSMLHQTSTKSSDTTSSFLNKGDHELISRLDLLYPRGEQEETDDQWCSVCDSGQPTRREHPQELQLQQFKKEFEAWQAARFKQCSTVAQLVNIIPPKSTATACHIRKATSSKRNPCTDDGEIQHISGSAPDKIVILKPGPDGFSDPEDDSRTTCSPAASHERGGSIENFLQQVKQRLEDEVEGKAFEMAGPAFRRIGIESPFREIPSLYDHPKQTTNKHATPSVYRDMINTKLVRSESARSSPSEMQFKVAGPFEFLKRDTRQFCSNRLKNIINRTATSRSAAAYLEITEEEDEKEEEEKEEMQARWLWHDEDEAISLCKDSSSPRNLMRSMSAPVSGTSFGKLLLEDRHILTGAQIRRKHEVLETKTQTRRKERFNIKQKVSSLRHKLTLRGRLFGKRFHRVESCNYGRDIRVVNIRQPIAMTFGERQMSMIMENSTEVPPSPASICSSGQEDLWRVTDYITPVSTPDVTLEDENGMHQVFRDICHNLRDLRRKINQLGTREDEEVGRVSVDCAVEQEEEEDEKKGTLGPGRQMEDKAEACYIKDLLIISGLYDGSSPDMPFTSSRPRIPKSVFEQLEEEASWKKPVYKDTDETGIMRGNVDRKMLYDLVNEALVTLLPAESRSVWTPSMGRGITTAARLPTLRGKWLLERVWKMIQEYLYPLPHTYPCDVIHNSMIERHLGSITSWSCGMNQEAEGFDQLGKDMQFLIVEDMIEEMVKELMHP